MSVDEKPPGQAPAADAQAPAVAGAGRADPAAPPPAATGPRRRRGRTILRTAVSAVLIAAVFGLALPHLASYRSVWVTIEAMTWAQVLLLGAATAGSMLTCWIAICSVLPSVRLHEAAVVNLASTAVANTLPAGGVLAMGVSWAMLSSWGVSAADYVLYTLVSGIWNVLIRLSLPVVALLVLATTSRPADGLLAATGAGLVLLAAMAGGFGLLLRSEPVARRADRWLQRALAIACRLARRPPPARVAGSVLTFREQAAALLAARGWRITAATAASHIALWLVLLACLRSAGLSAAQVSWPTSLAAFAFVRLVTVLPITPGGLGITELGLVGILGAGASHAVTARVVAAVLLYRALTYVLPIPLGAAAGLAWRHAPALFHASRDKAGPGGLRGREDDDETGQPAATIS
jgi:putative heme transporter